MVNINMYKIAKAKLSPNLTCVKERQCQIVVVCVLQLRTHTQYSHKSQGSTTRPLCASSTHTELTTEVTSQAVKVANCAANDSLA